MTNEHTTTRRTVLRTSAAAATTAAGLGGATAASAQETTAGGSEPDYGGWFDNVSNYDGTVDMTGEDQVTITVGASGNNGAYAFGPAAVHVDPGTEVVWEWSGDGGRHNVSAENADFESELSGEAGHTFSQTLDGAGIIKYACVPHKQMGMKGAVVVGDPAAGSSGLSTNDVLTVGGGVGIVGVLFGLMANEVRNDA